MQQRQNSFVGLAFLRSVWADDYERFKAHGDDERLVAKLRQWSQRADLTETSAEAAFLQTFFADIWGYDFSGGSDATAFTLYPQYPVRGAGAKGNTGGADLAIGHFQSHDAASGIPQVLCEFKDIRSSLDAPQKSRRDNTRSPVKQCLDYLSASRRVFFGNEAILPTWGIVTDMNEFRLYWHDRGATQFLSFVIEPRDLFQGDGLLSDGDAACFRRFLFSRVFHRDALLTTGGNSALEQLIARQWVREREIQEVFYAEYRGYREALYTALVKHNPDFPGTRGRLVRIAQKILDRFIFIFYCEDMGQALSFRPQLLRDFLIHECKDEYFDEKSDSIWKRLLGLFERMNEGGDFGDATLSKFNGGLFATDPEIRSLTLPNRIFCAKGQGQNEGSLVSHKTTLLYLSAAYNYAAGGAQGRVQAPSGEDGIKAVKSDPERALGLYTLGRIFEQSITELEILEAKADGLLSVNEESKRKRDGVYYTPEWVVERIVAETLQPRLHELREECGWVDGGFPGIDAVDAYAERLQSITILDPACGSGAFLITTLNFLVAEWEALRDIRLQAARAEAKAAGVREGSKAHETILARALSKRDDATLIRDILAKNIYGVDINPASVEIARLALWLHTARGDAPLTTLDDTIRDGNSLIGPDFYEGRMNLDRYDDEAQRERVNAFDWQAKFPEVFARGGFDAIVGNPPYVKLQNFRKVHDDMAAHLRTRGDSGASYESTQTGNFDLYLPFIEQGLQLLNDHGRMGYIAPNLWAVNEYGAGLRKHIARGRNLAGWIDFKAHQIFDEATTYTALQFFTKAPNDAVRIASAPRGIVPQEPWTGVDAALPYDRLDFGDRWLMLTGVERKLIDRLYKTCKRLDDPAHTSNIFVGIQTSADPIYHLDRLGPERYLCTPRGKNPPPPYEVAIEDSIMKPLVSGAEAKRYVTPAPITHILFPYDVDDDGAHLIDTDTMATRYPLAWAHLRSYEAKLRGRESDSFDDAEWYRFGRNQNLDKQEITKLMVPRLVANLHCALDLKGEIYLDNVDVGGIAVAKNEAPNFLSGLLNGPVCDYVFRRISKPFRGDYKSANKQFIAPLPIPKATKAQRASVADKAERLQKLHTARRDALGRIAKRLANAPSRARPETWLFPTLSPAADREDDAPSAMDNAERRKWAKDRYADDVTARLEAMGDRLTPGVGLDATHEDEELRFLIDGVPVIEGIYVDDSEGPFIAAQWKVLAQTFSVTEKTTGKKLANALRKLARTDNTALMGQVVGIQDELETLETDIANEEAAINTEIYALYRLTDAERELIEAG